MSLTFAKFKKSGLNLAPLGVEKREDNSPYFCTPRGASVFGWAGVDGIHFCRVRGFGEMVFAVSPMNTYPDYVHPIAENFEDFLRLLLAVGDVAVLDQAWQWNEEEFARFLRENPPTEEQCAVLAEIRGRFSLTPMEEPYAYLFRLREGFDASRLSYTEDFYDTELNPELPLGDWKVTFEGDFWNNRGRAAEEVRINRSFQTAAGAWGLIPSFYLTAQGLLMDLILMVPQEKMRSYEERGERLARENGSPAEERALLEEEPLSFPGEMTLTVNGKPLREDHSCTIIYTPPEEGFHSPEREAVAALTHYGLDLYRSWCCSITRVAFAWATKRRPKIKEWCLTLQERALTLVGERFSLAAGEEVSFPDPVTGISHTLRAGELLPQELPEEHFRDEELLFPRHFTMMTYAVTPPLSGERFALEDCRRPDSARRRPAPSPERDALAEKYGLEPQAESSVVMGIIGGADGPTAVLVGGVVPEQ